MLFFRMNLCFAIFLGIPLKFFSTQIFGGTDFFFNVHLIKLECRSVPALKVLAIFTESCKNKFCFWFLENYIYLCRPLKIKVET
jgi:hypothetical protein